MLMKINKNPSPKELRQFGWTLIIGFAVLGGLFFWRHKIHGAYGLWGIGISLGIVSLLSQAIARVLYRIWMGWAFVMGTIVTRVILTGLFFGILTPVALLFRLFGRDILHLKRDATAGSYWSDHRKISDKSYYQRLF